jgi:CheY-like chemotaxis protein
MMLLIEDNADDEALTLRALQNDNISNEIIVAHDGVEALDFLFGTGSHAGRDPAGLPELVLLDLKLPKIYGFEVLKQLPRRSAHSSAAGGHPHLFQGAAGHRDRIWAGRPTATCASRSISISSSKESDNWALLAGS